MLLFLALALATSAPFGLQRAVVGGGRPAAQPLPGGHDVDRLAVEFLGSPPDPGAAALVARLPLSVHIEGPLVESLAPDMLLACGHDRR